MTPHETALHLIRQRGTTLSEHRPGETHFVVAYLLEEASRTKDGNPLRLSDHPEDRMRFVWGDLKDAFRPFASLMRQVGAASASTSAEMERLREAYEAGRQFQNDTNDQPLGRI